MKYIVKFSCGHEEEIQVYGSREERERKVKYFEECGLCHDCYVAEKKGKLGVETKEVEMFYGDYKRDYNDCTTKAGSYDKKSKTIIVNVPVDRI